MTTEEFNDLTHIEQDEIVANSGTYLVNYVQGDFMCDVYKVEHFFVKFCYDLSKNEKPEISAFAGSENLHLYENNYRKTGDN
jgi:hypothetical protein